MENFSSLLLSLHLIAADQKASQKLEITNDCLKFEGGLRRKPIFEIKFFHILSPQIRENFPQFKQNVLVTLSSPSPPDVWLSQKFATVETVIRR